MTLADLVAAGAPALPPGLFYRVAWHGMTESYAVHIRRPGRWGSRRLAMAYLLGGLTLEKVVDAAGRAVAYLDYVDETDALIGDHR